MPQRPSLAGRLIFSAPSCPISALPCPTPAPLLPHPCSIPAPPLLHPCPLLLHPCPTPALPLPHPCPTPALPLCPTPASSLPHPFCTPYLGNFLPSWLSLIFFFLICVKIKRVEPEGSMFEVGWWTLPCTGSGAVCFLLCTGAVWRMQWWSVCGYCFLFCGGSVLPRVSWFHRDSGITGLYYHTQLLSPPLLSLLPSFLSKESVTAVQAGLRLELFLPGELWTSLPTLSPWSSQSVMAFMCQVVVTCMLLLACLSCEVTGYSPPSACPKPIFSLV